MKKIELILLVCLTGCRLLNYQSKPIESSTKNYVINAKVSRENNSDVFAIVIIQVCDKRNKKIIDINTHAGDVNKWAIGWTTTGDTIVLYSSDIGNKAWTNNKNGWLEIENLSKGLDLRAEELYKSKYKLN